MSLVDNSSDEETCTRLNKTTITIIITTILQKNSPVKHGMVVELFIQPVKPYYGNPESRRKRFVALPASFLASKHLGFAKPYKSYYFVKLSSAFLGDIEDFHNTFYL